MPYRTLTVAREYGSGGAEIAGLAAQRLGWKLLDRNLIDKIARRAGVELEVARACDEHVDSWLHRISKPLWQGDVAAVATLSPVDVFDAESMARQTREVIEEASAAGNCVIVGRGGQCVLRGRTPSTPLSTLRGRAGWSASGSGCAPRRGWSGWNG